MSDRNADPDPWDDPLWYARYRSDPDLGRAAPRGPRLQRVDRPRLARAVVVALLFFGLWMAVASLGPRFRRTDSEQVWAFAGYLAMAGVGWYVHSAEDQWLNWGLLAGLLLPLGVVVVRVVLYLS